VAVTREHRRAKTDRLDTELLKRGFLGWLRGEHRHCKMVAVPTLAEEDAKRPSRERETLVGEASRIITRVKAAFVRLGIRSFNPKLKTAAAHLEILRTPEGEPIPPNTLAALKRDLERHRTVKQQIREIEETRLERLAQAPSNGPHAMVRLLARAIGVGVETADMLVQEVLSRNMPDRRAVARYSGLTGSPDESGAKRREKGLARSGNARVWRGMIQLAWRSLCSRRTVRSPNGIGSEPRMPRRRAGQALRVAAKSAAILDCHSTRWRSRTAVGAEEWLRRGQTKEWARTQVSCQDFVITIREGRHQFSWHKKQEQSRISPSTRSLLDLA
jgi:transposase